MKRGKLAKSGGIKLPDGRNFRNTGNDNKGYKYLGVFEVDDIMHNAMKSSTKKESKESTNNFKTQWWESYQGYKAY